VTRRRGQLDGQRHALQPAADPRHRRHVRFGHREPTEVSAEVESTYQYVGAQSDLICAPQLPITEE
jgi:hypothetical protein